MDLGCFYFLVCSERENLLFCGNFERIQSRLITDSYCKYCHIIEFTTSLLDRIPLNVPGKFPLSSSCVKMKRVPIRRLAACFYLIVIKFSPEHMEKTHRFLKLLVAERISYNRQHSGKS